MLNCPSSDPSLPDHHVSKCPAPHEDYVVYNGECYKAVTDAKTWEVRRGGRCCRGVTDGTGSRGMVLA